MSLYSDYLKEREGVDTLETKEGFITYIFRDQDCYILDIYVVPSRRKSGVAERMADRVAEMAKELGYHILTGSVDTRLPSAKTSAQVLTAYGMKLGVTEGYLTYFYKEI